MQTSLGKQNRLRSQDPTAGRNGDHGDRLDVVDYKMVTFSLGGKDYGIDIMKVKEIAKFGNFTYVPNTPPFVVGVYNLRGDIISILDLRKMFHLPIPEAQKSVEDGLILRLENNLLGVIVDSIDKVVGISSSSIQPPHPIFGDINIKYISGVVENDDRLYIILDTERIFGRESTDEKAEDDERPSGDLDDGVVVEELDSGQPETGDASIGLGFVRDTLATFSGFHTSEINEEWVADRFEEWRGEKGAAEAQLVDKDEADRFLEPFFSPYTGRLWSEAYAAAVEAVLPEAEGNVVNAWNPGCGKGYETYCLFALMKKKYRGKRVKIWAGDNDLLSISTAPNLVFPSDSVPAYLKEFVTEGKSGLSLKQDLKDQILFEYHDVTHETTVPDVDIILARDVLSFLKVQDQHRLLDEMGEKLKAGGVIITGKNERPAEDYVAIRTDDVAAFRRA